MSELPLPVFKTRTFEEGRKFLGGLSLQRQSGILLEAQLDPFRYQITRDLFEEIIKDLGWEDLVESEYYVDDSRHLACWPLSVERLHQMADHLSINRCWFHRDHYDVPKQRVQEIRERCRGVISPRTMVKLVREGKRPSDYLQYGLPPD